MLYWIFYILTWLPFRLMFRVKVVGKKNLPKSGCVIVCNHYSNWDGILLNAFVSRFYYLSKKELFKNKFSAWLCKILGCFPVDREGTDIKAIKFSLKTLKENKKLCIFPEGTRNKTGSEDMQELKHGAIMIASKAGKQIVPIMLNRPPKVFGKITISIGEPITLEGENLNKLTKEEMQQNAEIMQQKMEELRK